MLGPFPVLASDFKLIANSSLKADAVSAEELKKIFLEESSSLSDGTHVEPVLESDGPVHRAFLQQCLGRTSDDLQTCYRAPTPFPVMSSSRREPPTRSPFKGVRQCRSAPYCRPPKLLRYVAYWLRK